MKRHLFGILSFFIIACAATVSASAQSGAIVTDELNSVSLEGNLVGDSPKRNVLVYLPPDYGKQKKMRYPVVYLLHGFGFKGNKFWVDEKRFNVETINRLIAEGKINPMIVVMPDGSNKFGGSYYTNSIATGNWEDFITRELVSYIDKKYRTLPNAASRGIAGHSMGGYGAIKLAMKHPDIYGAVYGTSSCCLNIYPGQNPTNKALEDAAAIKSWEEAKKATFLVLVARAYAAAFSPNPSKPPFFSDFPLNKTGESNTTAEHAQARWLANIPNWMVDQYRTNLLQLRAIAFDAGTKEDPPILKGSREFSETLKRNQIEHSFEEFEGGHFDKVTERIETKLLPLFSRTLVFQPSSKKAVANNSK
ncbi:MAG: esterase family protein [Acidobacteria bacterium]|nr:esterase family protein [Acidobacteriota bacterium]